PRFRGTARVFGHRIPYRDQLRRVRNRHVAIVDNSLASSPDGLTLASSSGAISECSPRRAYIRPTSRSFSASSPLAFDTVSTPIFPSITSTTRLHRLRGIVPSQYRRLFGW